MPDRHDQDQVSVTPWSHVPNLESFLQELYIRSTGLSAEPTSAQFSALSAAVQTLSANLTSVVGTANQISVTNAGALRTLSIANPLVTPGDLNIISTDLVLTRDAANVLALKNAANAQEFRVYGTTTGSKFFAHLHTGTEARTNILGDWLIQTTNAALVQTPRIRIKGDQDATQVGVNAAPPGTYTFYVAGTIGLSSSLDLQTDSGLLRFGLNTDVILARDAANILALRNGTNAQEFRLYGTVVGANADVVSFRYEANIAYLDVSRLGTGTFRPLIIRTGGGEAIIRLEAADTGAGEIRLYTDTLERWRIGGGIFFPVTTNAVDIGGPSNLVRSLYYGTTLFGLADAATIRLGALSDVILARDDANTLRVRNSILRVSTGNNAVDSILYLDSGTATAVFRPGGGNKLQFQVQAGVRLAINQDDGRIELYQHVEGTGISLTVGASGAIGFRSSDLLGSTRDVSLSRDAAAILALVNGVNAQTFRVYGTTTGSKYTLLKHDGTDGTLDVAAASGKLILGGNASDIQWGKALVALGGGVAPTLGTIGGGGPTVAAQNTWMQARDSTGALFWVPAWK